MANPTSEEIQLWLVKIPALNAQAPFGWPVLSQEERMRAARFNRPEDRHRFAFCRTTLRRLLGEYLELEPGLVPIEYSTFGKPQIAGTEKRRIEFNLSHSGPWAIFAFVTDRPVGVDVECWLPEGEWEELVGHALTPTEIQQLAKLPVSCRRESFFRTWTRKEALLKALGTGLSTEMNQLEIGLPALGHEMVSVTIPDQTAPSDWWLAEIQLGPKVSATVAAPGKAGTITLRHLE